MRSLFLLAIQCWSSVPYILWIKVSGSHTMHFIDSKDKVISFATTTFAVTLNSMDFILDALIVSQRLDWYSDKGIYFDVLSFSQQF